MVHNSWFESKFVQNIAYITLLSQQPSRYYIPVVHYPSKSNPLFYLQSVQVACDQNCPGSAPTRHRGPVPLQYARLHGQETSWSLSKENNKLFLISKIHLLKCCAENKYFDLFLDWKICVAVSMCCVFSMF